nr:Rrf2 family transcriptional regulator [Aliiroseovarius subalbicans]
MTVKTNLAMRVLMFCAVNEARTVRKSEVAEACNASANHLGVIINQLGHGGFLETTRGRGGGIQLKLPAADINVGAVFRLFESGLPFAECFSAAENTCPIAVTCRLKNALVRALDAFYRELDELTVADLVVGNNGLYTLFDMNAMSLPTCTRAAG